MEDPAVPIVSLAAPEAEAAEVLRLACTEHGFFYLTDHGVSEELVQAAFAAQRAFFSRTLEEKMRIKANKYYRGYTPFAEETLDPQRSRHGDSHEGLYYGRHVEEGSPEAELPLHGPNQWPDETALPGYRAATEAYLQAVAALGCRLLRLLALSLGLAADHFSPHFTRPMLFLRPLHYSAERSSEAEGLYAAGAHTDYGMLTFLRTDGQPGLQICTDGAAWRDVPPIPGAFHCNLGDMLARWTNGRYRSTLHRVVNRTGRERYSIAFFFEPNFDAEVAALPQCLEHEQPPLFPPTTAGAHILERYNATHAGYGAAATGAAA
ncbi:Adenine guanine permease AZG1 [Micractinium conductrix]|uniref:Adenine guanine permease AZG1 n=1 Tax=Micractinium conductrix TaxID=554055 RepID=A0A2P6VN83_9CHLO|nr:Adenine guanine permease AZG1 [Micractinium conductrix]|eukprot:PSC75554.1 Adenine guanine permease AZG1 [Micractinium conductrix]